MMASPVAHVSPPRAAVARRLAGPAASFPDLTPVSHEFAELEGRDQRLATHIVRLALQRWLTLEHLLDQFCRPRFARLEPSLRGVLLSAAAQIVFMDRQPAHAVVGESVELARSLVRPAAAGLVNAVLRRLSELVVHPFDTEPWSAAEDRLPLASGSVRLVKPCLPPTQDWPRHLSIATSHPIDLVESWRGNFGGHRALQLCLHDIQAPPTVVAVEQGWERSGEPAACAAHEQEGFVVWEGTSPELSAFVAAHPDRRVQDPGTARAVRASALIAQPRRILDFCAGRGTKTAQLASVFREARIVATEVNPQRQEALRRRFAGSDRVVVVEPEQAVAGHERFDLVLLDVPCSNTAVLGRRPEARYRMRPRTVRSLVDLQRRIARQAVPLAEADGLVVYSTCSLEQGENAAQLFWLSENLGLQCLESQMHFPSGSGRTYSDGCFYAVMRKS